MPSTPCAGFRHNYTAINFTETFKIVLDIFLNF